MNSLWLSHFTATSSIGRGLDQTLDALRQRRSGLVSCAFDTVDLATFIGEVAGVDAVQLPAHLADFELPPASDKPSRLAWAVTAAMKSLRACGA